MISKISSWLFTVILLSVACVAQLRDCQVVAQSNGYSILQATNSPLTSVQGMTTFDQRGAYHDLFCITQPSFGTTNSFMLFPSNTVFTNANTGTNPVVMDFTNINGTSRAVKLNFGDTIGGIHETNFFLAIDNAHNQNEDVTWQGGNGIVSEYFTGNCPTQCTNTFVPAAGIKQFLISDGSTSATTNPKFGIVAGHFTTGITGNNDRVGTLTCALGTVTYTFTIAMTTTTYRVMLTDQTTTGGALVSAKNLASFDVSCTGLTDSVDYMVVGNPY